MNETTLALTLLGIAALLYLPELVARLIVVVRIIRLAILDARSSTHVVDVTLGDGESTETISVNLAERVSVENFLAALGRKARRR